MGFVRYRGSSDLVLYVPSQALTEGSGDYQDGEF